MIDQVLAKLGTPATAAELCDMFPPEQTLLVGLTLTRLVIDKKVKANRALSFLTQQPRPKYKRAK